MQKVIIFGNAKLAELAHYYFTNDSVYKIIGFTVNEKYITGREYLGLPLIPFEEIENKFPPNDYKMFVAIGYNKLNTLRANMYYKAKEKGYKLINYISSRASRWDNIEFGDNCFILENQVIQPFVKIGNDVTIWCNSHFGHNTIIEDHCWISPHAAICGGVKIGSYSFIGTNVTIRDNASIGQECIIGAGAIILNDTKDKEVYVAKATETFRLDSTKFQRLMDISK